MSEYKTAEIVAGNDSTFWPAYKYLRNFYNIPRAAYYAYYFWRGYMIPVPAKGGGYFQINGLEVPSEWCA